MGVGWCFFHISGAHQYLDKGTDCLLELKHSG